MKKKKISEPTRDLILKFKLYNLPINNNNNNNSIESYKSYVLFFTIFNVK